MNTIRRSERIRSRARPQLPTLQTSSRKRNNHIPSQEEREEAELEQIRKYKFTAKPAPDHVFRGAAPVGIPPKTKRRGTVPKTPEAMKHKLVVSRRGITKTKQPTNKAVKRLKALPLPDLMKVFEVTKKERTTKPAPFSFEKKYPKPREVAQRLLEEAVLKEKQQREFRAQPLFETEAFTVDKNMSKSCTKVEPFKLSHPTAHEDKLKKIDETIDKENEELEKKREFQARYPHVLHDPAFLPDKPSRICEVDEFDLHSAKRGEERKKFDEETKELSRCKDSVAAAQAEEIKKIEEEEVTELRKKMVHRANRVGEFKKQQYEDIS